MAIKQQQQQPAVHNAGSHRVPPNLHDNEDNDNNTETLMDEIHEHETIRRTKRHKKKKTAITSSRDTLAAEAEDLLPSREDPHHHRSHQEIQSFPTKKPTTTTTTRNSQTIFSDEALAQHGRECLQEWWKHLHLQARCGGPTGAGAYVWNRDLSVGEELDGLRHCQVAVLADVHLERPKDAHNSQRVELAHQCQSILYRRLSQRFPSHYNHAEYLLHVRVALASEGRRAARMWAAELGYGWAKLVVLICLQDVETGNVLGGFRLCHADHLGWGCGDLCDRHAGYYAVLRMAEQVANELLLLLSVERA